jgi:Protein of unknown function (DUF2958)
MHQFDRATLAAIPEGEDNPRFSSVQAALAHDLKGGARRAELPPLYSTESQGDDPIVRFKCFTPWSNWTWYAIEFDGDSLCFGLVDGHEVELGYFDLNELESVRGRWGLRIERDLHWEPKPLSELKKKIDR